jgi:hypothetical protein
VPSYSIFLFVTIDLILKCFFVFRFGAFLYNFFICHYRSIFKVFFFCFLFWCLPIKEFVKQKQHTLSKRRYISIQATPLDPTLEYNLILITVWKLRFVLILYF